MPAKTPAAPEPAPEPAPLPITVSIAAEEKVIAQHVAAAIGAAAGLLTLLHPGFHVPTVVEEVVVPVSWATAGAIEIFDLVTHRGLVKAIAALAKEKS